MNITGRKVTTLAVAAFALLAVADFWQRILVPRHFEARPASSFVPAKVPPPATAASIRQELSTWLPKLQPIADPSGGPEVAGGWELTLLAVFDDQRSRFAVVRAHPAAGGGAGEVRRVVAGDEVHGFRVARIEPLSVVLEDPKGERELRLFRPAVDPVIGTGPGPTPVAPAAARPGAPVATAAATAPVVPPPAGAKSVGSATPASAPAGAKAVASQELKAGQAFELPESMRGLKFVENPPPPSSAKPKPQGAPPPQKP